MLLVPHPDSGVRGGGESTLAAALPIPPLSSLSLPLPGDAAKEAGGTTASRLVSLRRALAGDRHRSR
jgi:hypothetical protein